LNVRRVVGTDVKGGDFRTWVKQLMGKDTQGVKMTKHGAKESSEISETLEFYLGLASKCGWRLGELGADIYEKFI
jgi:hypothetical protein